MENTLLIGLSRQMALQRELDVIANNIANVNTAGFKADGNIFQEYVNPVARSDRFADPDRRLSFVLDRSTWHDLSKGAVQQTGNPLDVVIDGNAFLAVQTPAGERYTRNGALQINAQGELVTGEGHRVLGENGPILFQPGDRNIVISREGTITVREGANVVESQRGKLRLVGFAQPGRLRKDGSSLFAAPAGLTPQPEPAAAVSQGFIEKSNVRAVVEMTRMIEVTRSYTTVAGVLQQQHDLRRTAIERLADVPA
jgi:flagellar basal-body rod protein FlgF/flagellar basal-body rod protein FlgG